MLLPQVVSRSLLSLRSEAGANDPVFASAMAEVGRAQRQRHGEAVKAGIDAQVSAHWLRHAHGPHAIDRGASLPAVQNKLGYGNIATTSGDLHARPTAQAI